MSAVFSLVFIILGALAFGIWLVLLNERMLRFWCRLAGIACFSFFVLATMAALQAAKAHGDAQWIMENQRYVDASGTHCCGPSDCKREAALFFRESPEGIWVTSIGEDMKPHESLMKRELVGRGLYPSIDDNWWICARGGVVKCVFKPTTGT